MPACLPWITLDSRDAILWGSLICGILEFWTSSERMADTRPSTRLSFRSSSPVVAGTISVETVLAATGLEPLRLATTLWILCSSVP
jgi:hypothetical protein